MSTNPDRLREIEAWLADGEKQAYPMLAIKDAEKHIRYLLKRCAAAEAFIEQNEQDGHGSGCAVCEAAYMKWVTEQEAADAR
ncbi:hypothetical protein HYS50_03460 [Candidatus Woesearchaeota archaeon]|nr:hypothetical protein [Candidatus Woesearchaeota archaeon]